MNQQDYRKVIDTAIAAVAEQNKKTPEDAKMGELMVMGLTLLGEVLTDIKRIADGAEQYHHYTIPEGYELFQEGAIVTIRPIVHLAEG